MSEQGGAPSEAAGAESAAAAQEQGGEGADLYGPFLEGINPELHQLVRPALEKQNQSFSKRAQDSLEFANKFRPYGELGLDNYDPGYVGELVGFGDMIDAAFAENPNPQAIEQLSPIIADMAQRLGVGQLDEESWAQQGEENGWLAPQDGGDGEEGGDQTDQIVAKVMEAIGPQLQPLQEYVGNEQETRQTREQAQQFDQRYQELVAEHKLFTDETPQEQKQEIFEDIRDLATAFVQRGELEDPLGKATEKYLRMRGGAQSDAIDEKLTRQNGATLQGGQADTRAEPLSWNGNGPSPADAAKARMRA